MSEDHEDDDKKEFKRLFAFLGHTIKQSVDTRPFCSVWKGWGKRPVNVREQQDAGEFLNLFLDQQPETCQSLFKGELVHTIQGIDVDYKSENIEPFFTLQIDVKGFANLEASYASFLQEEMFCGEDARQTEKGRIDVKKFTRVRKAPPVLVFHLMIN